MACRLLDIRRGSTTGGVAPPQPVPVTATTVQQREVPIVLCGLGTVTALNKVTVRSQIQAC